MPRRTVRRTSGRTVRRTSRRTARRTSRRTAKKKISRRKGIYIGGDDNISDISDISGLFQQHYKSFMTNIAITAESDTSTEIIINKLVEKSTTISNLTQEKVKSVKDALENKCPDKSCGDKWIKCGGACETQMVEWLKGELSLTLYILKILNDGLVDVTKEQKCKIKLQFTGPTDNLTGKWTDDSKHFKLEVAGDSPFVEDEADGKLIMGLGPSAAGKTYNAKKFMKCFSESDPSNFPKCFLQIDGGIMRESSFFYGYILKIIENARIGGLINLVGSTVMQNSLFNSDIPKKTINDFLINSVDVGVAEAAVAGVAEGAGAVATGNNGKKGKKGYFRLYVPETCPSGCGKKIEKYKQLTGTSQTNKWIMLLIWQCKNGGTECCFKESPKSNTYTCVGCTESGTNRENQEGKKYSNAAWPWSMKNGGSYLVAKDNTSIRFSFHNSGVEGNTSVLMYYGGLGDFGIIELGKILKRDKSVKLVVSGDRYESVVPVTTGGYSPFNNIGKAMKSASNSTINNVGKAVNSVSNSAINKVEKIVIHHPEKFAKLTDLIDINTDVRNGAI
jgi:hypothetical protein